MVPKQVGALEFLSILPSIRTLPIPTIILATEQIHAPKLADLVALSTIQFVAALAPTALVGFFLSYSSSSYVNAAKLEDVKFIWLTTILPLQTVPMCDHIARPFSFPPEIL
ncbi:hypothetical protein HPP92_019581 [Vanilla planifolia]|uniref:Uncharacterized protein n=1 Tax=Vanilla planifolia TaxID=51239 RepID=A0A835Q931_VANPL|nr:hypothetical protein HPP92_019581 [Vanilla planifolia]